MWISTNKQDESNRLTDPVDGSDALENMNQEMKAETKSYKPSKYDKIRGGNNFKV